VIVLEMLSGNTDHCCRYGDRTCDPPPLGPELAWCVGCYYARASRGPGLLVATLKAGALSTAIERTYPRGRYLPHGHDD
jgi:hypothetical protein